MSDFYASLSPAPRVLVPRFSAPAHVTIGPDGIPDYVEATKGSPYQYIAPRGKRLAIYHNGVRIKQIVVADRKRGFAVGLHYTENPDWTLTFHPTDKDGQTQHRFYEGHITFRLIYGPGPKVFGIKSIYG